MPITRTPFERLSAVRLMIYVALGTLTLAAQATTVFEGSMTITSASPTQLGRLFRGGVPQDWSGDEVFPGLTNTGLVHHYTALSLNLSALEEGYQYGQFVQVSIDSVSTNTFLAAYLNTYDPTNATTVKATWLGDTGLSGNTNGGLDTQTFQVKVGSGDRLLLVLNETTPSAGLNTPGSILVEAFADDTYTDLVTATPVPAVPEPASWACLGLGFIALSVMRQRLR